MEIFEMAKLLGLAIREDDRIKKLEEAKLAYENDETIRILTTEYDVQQKALATAYGSAERDDAFINSVNERIAAIYEEVIATEAYKQYEKAQNAVNDLMEQVNNAIQAAVSGIEPDGCTHNCATCKGCH
jgi:cell fate (sporulation/competence/biofilm development) regulator YlbF (YheA/YmcA/DUF963 family)